MGPVFLLSLRQLSGKWRLGIILLLAAVPILISVGGSIFGAERGNERIDDG